MINSTQKKIHKDLQKFNLEALKQKLKHKDKTEEKTTKEEVLKETHLNLTVEKETNFTYHRNNKKSGETISINIDQIK